MKKILTALVGVLLLSGASISHAIQGPNQDDDPIGMTTIGPGATQADIITFKMKPGGQGGSVVITTNVALGIASGGALYNTFGLFNQDDVFIALPAGASDSVKTGGLTIATSATNLTSLTSTYYFADVSSQPRGCPRNIVIYSSAIPLGIATTTLVGTVTFYGIDNLGNYTSEQIQFSTTPVVIGTYVPAGLGNNATGYVYNTTGTATFGQGKVAWAYISSFTVQITSFSAGFTTGFSSVALFIGFGNRIGLSNDIKSANDVYYIAETDNYKTSVPGRVDPIFNTYTPVTIPDGIQRYRLRYRVKNSPRK